jgi:hypothetical protein
MNKIISSVTVAALCCLACSVVAIAQAADEHHAAQPLLAPFTKLEGEWIGKGVHGDMEHEAKVVYKVTSGGSAVVETIDPDGEHEMITVIHPDGDSLLLTHYCMIGNQPQMRAKPKADKKEIAFEFVQATNMKSDKDMHMHNVTYKFIDDDTIEAVWTNFADGKESGTAVFSLKRKK